MAAPSSHNITGLLQAWCAGDQSALEQLLPLVEAELHHLAHQRSADLVALDDALSALAAFDPRKNQIVELRLFGGLNVEETAEVLKISPITVIREWNNAKAWLYHKLSAGGRDDA
jgi:DNA-directed RNA polymerase specialized sigma24 family protein